MLEAHHKNRIDLLIGGLEKEKGFIDEAIADLKDFEARLTAETDPDKTHEILLQMDNKNFNPMNFRYRVVLPSADHIWG